MTKNEKKEKDPMRRWWGDYDVGLNQPLLWQIGTKSIWISRSHKEWKIASIEHQDPFDDKLT